MSRGRRYNEEGRLNYVKVFAVGIAIVVIIMCIAIVKNLMSRGKNVVNEEVTKNVDYYALYANNKWGIVDTSGKTLIEPMYQEMIIVLDNKKDVFLCTYDVNEETGEYKTKAINKDNKEIYAEYEMLEPLANYDNDGNVWYEENAIRVKSGDKYGLIDLAGKQILSTEYEEIETLKGIKNSILVKKDGKYGLVNNLGTVIIPTEYAAIEKIDEKAEHGFIVIDENKKYGLFSSKGNKILENNYEKIAKIYGENYFVIEENGKQILINANGEKVLTSGYDKIAQINSDGIVFRKDKKYGFMDYEGKIIIEAKFDELEEVKLGIFKAKKDNKYGIIDSANVEKIAFQYNDINYEEKADLYIAEKEDFTSDIINAEFAVALNGIISEFNNEKSYIQIKIGEDYKYYNLNLEEKDVKDILTSNSLFVSKKDGKFGYVDKEGNVKVDYIYDEAKEQNQYGYAAIKKDNLWGAIDSDGKVVIDPKYDLNDYLLIDFIGKWHLGQDINMNYYCEK